MGPLLFALYVNDLPAVVQYSVLDLYTDDAEMHCSHSDLGAVEKCLQSDLDNVAHWLCSPRLCLNVMSNSMLIGSHQRIANKILNVTFGGKVLNSVHYLGVTIDPSLSWNLQVSNVVFNLELLHYFGLGHYHQRSSVHCILLLCCLCMIVVMLSGVLCNFKAH